MKKLLKLIPYAYSIVFGVILYSISDYFSEDLKGLLIGAAGSFFAIPLIFLGYEFIKQLADRELNRELFDYAKMQVDREILTIIYQLSKILLPYDKIDKTKEGVTVLLNHSVEEIKNILSTNEYVGFQLKKKWTFSEQGLHNFLQNPYILKRLENEQIITIIAIIKAVRALEGVQDLPSLYQEIDKTTEGYHVVSGQELSESNSDYPDRYLLLKRIFQEHYKVEDFGDFASSQRETLLKVYKYNNALIPNLAHFLFDFIKELNKWVSQTGNAFLIDTKMFRIKRRNN